MWTATAIGTLRFAWLLPGLVLTGISIALVTTPASTDAMNTAPRAWRGQAQGVIQTLRHMGGTVGLAIMGTVVASIQRARLAAFASQTSASTAGRTNVTAILSAAHGDRAMLKSLSAGTLGALRDSLAAGIGGALCISGAVVLAGAIAAWTLLRRVPAADASVMPPQAARLGPDTSWNQDGSRERPCTLGTQAPRTFADGIHGAVSVQGSDTGRSAGEADAPSRHHSFG